MNVKSITPILLSVFIIVVLQVLPSYIYGLYSKEEMRVLFVDAVFIGSIVITALIFLKNSYLLLNMRGPNVQTLINLLGQAALIGSTIFTSYMIGADSDETKKIILSCLLVGLVLLTVAVKNYHGIARFDSEKTLVNFV